LRNLERDGLLTREVYAEVPPRVEYELTALGKGFMTPVCALVDSLQANWLSIKTARDAFDNSLRAYRCCSSLNESLDSAEDRSSDVCCGIV
jgi:DNA-binding PadR family transcriptional regulator